MKVTGPGGPTRPPAVDSSTDVAPADRSRETAPVAAVGGATPTDPIAAVAADLRAGHLTPKQAVDRLVDLAIGDVGALGEAQRAELRKRLETLLAEDPFLTEKTRRLGVRNEESGD